MSLSSSPLLSLLAQPAQPVPGDSFGDRALMLFAALAVADGRLDYRSYQTAQEACRKLFGDRALHAELQAKLHHALLRPPSDPSVLIAETARLIKANDLPRSEVDALLDALALFADPDMPGAERLCALTREATDAVNTGVAPSEAGSARSMGARFGRWWRKTAWTLPGLRNRENRTSVPRQPREGEDAEAAAAELAELVRSFGNEDLCRKTDVFCKAVRPHPFRIVVLGEGKRGKSSLVNALLGRKLSPDETAVPVVFRYTETPECTASFLDERQFRRLLDYLEAEKKNRLLVSRAERIRQGMDDGTFVPGGFLAGISCPQGLDDCIRAGGRLSPFTARVSVGAPLPFLASGTELADTPGLNDTDAFRSRLAEEESLEADCLLFVMDARNPGTRSELELLRTSAGNGRAVTVIGVLTHADCPEGVADLQQAVDQAERVLEEACRLSPRVRPLGVVALNVREDMERRCKGEAASEEFDRLCGLLDEAARSESDKAARRFKTAENYAHLSSEVSADLNRHVQNRLAALPDPVVLTMLGVHADQLAESTRLSLEQARQVARAAVEDMESWERETERSLARLEETLVLRLMEAITAKTAALGRHFTGSGAWRQFDEEEIPKIARCTVDEFLREHHEDLQSREKKIRIFSRRMRECSETCLAKAASSVGGLDSGLAEAVFSRSGGKAAHFLVQSRHYMKNIALFTAGTAVGRASVLSPLALLISAGNVLALAVTSPALAAVVAAMAGTAGVIYHLGREDKRKAAFLQRRRKEAEAYSRRIVQTLREQLAGADAELAEAYETEVRFNFTPALENLFYQSIHLRLFLDVMERIRLDAGRHAEEVRTRLEAIEQRLVVDGYGIETETGKVYGHAHADPDPRYQET